MNELISEKYLINTPQVLFERSDDGSYCFQIFGRRSYSERNRYLKYMMDEKVLIKDGRILAEGSSGDLTVSFAQKIEKFGFRKIE